MIKGTGPILIIILFFIIYFGFKWKSQKITSIEFFYWVIFGIYIANVVSLTLFPFPYQKTFIRDMIKDNFGELNNFIPFKSMFDIFQTGSLSIVIKQLGGNIILFIPLSVGINVLLQGISQKKVLLYGFFTSLSIELIQEIANISLGFNYRSCDIDDIILNTIGTILGIFIWKILYKYLDNTGLLLKKSDVKYPSSSRQ